MDPDATGPDGLTDLSVPAGNEQPGQPGHGGIATDSPSGPGGEAEPIASPSTRRRNRWILEWGIVFLVAITVAVGIRTYVLSTYYIPSASMEPTLMVNDRILVDKLSYRFDSIHRGDIVVFAKPGDFSDGPGVNDLVKRVIGLPGDQVSSQDNQVFIDGKPLSEPWLPAGDYTTGIRPQTVPSGQLFVMGDNRNDSADSRVFGTIPKSLVVGRAIVRIWPLSRFHIF